MTPGFESFTEYYNVVYFRLLRILLAQHGLDSGPTGNRGGQFQVILGVGSYV